MADTPRVTVPVEVVAACEGEQEHFEAWAKSARYDMSEHPLHYIFTDPRTDAARMGWNAALAYVRDAAEPLSAAPAPVGGAVEPSWRESFIADEEEGPVSGILIDLSDGSQIWTGDCSSALLNSMGDERPDESGQFLTVAIQGKPTRVVASVASTQDGIALARALAAALATREEAPACKICGGKGYAQHEGGEGEGHPSRPEIEACACRAEEIDLYDDKVQAGIAWTMRQWGETLGLKTWDMGDGSESVEGDVGAEIHTILVDAGLRDPETNEMAALRAQPQAREDAQPDAGARLARAMWGVDLVPAANPALRVAVERLLPVARLNTRLGKAGDKLRSALDAVESALQAEQGGEVMADGVVPIEVDELAKLLHQKSQGEDAQWRGRRTNRAYYRRLAKAELARRATLSDKEGGE